MCALVVGGWAITGLATPASPTPIRDVYVVLLVLDGCRPDMLYQLIDAGILPNTKKYLVDEGTRFTQALTIFPSATMSAYQTMISGLFPGHAGIPYLQWFDRVHVEVHNFLNLTGALTLNRDFRNSYLGDIRATTQSSGGTLFDDLAGYPTAAVFSPYFRNATVRRPKSPLVPLWSLLIDKRYEQIDHHAYRDLLDLFHGHDDALPRFSLVALFGTDLLGHKYGPQHIRIRRNLIQFDAFLGDFIDLLRRRRILEKTYLIVTSDHGMHDIDGVFDIEALFEAHGLPTVGNHPRRDARVYIGERGVSVATVTVKAPQGWAVPIDYPTLRNYPVTGTFRLDLVSLLTEAPPTDLVLVRDHDRVRLVTSTAEAVVTHERRHGRSYYRYRAISGDPLQFARHRHLRAYRHGRPLTVAQWNAALARTDTPGAVPQLGQIFDDGRAGDMVVIAKLPWGFYARKAATHGTHRAIDMQIPLLIRGPSIPVGTRSVGQVTDLYPTMLQWFGLGVCRHCIDGTPLF